YTPISADFLAVVTGNWQSADQGCMIKTRIRQNRLPMPGPDGHPSSKRYLAWLVSRLTTCRRASADHLSEKPYLLQSLTTLQTLPIRLAATVSTSLSSPVSSDALVRRIRRWTPASANRLAVSRSTGGRGVTLISIPRTCDRSLRRLGGGRRY